MTITGRITADAVTNTAKDEQTVVNFSVAVNDTYKKKSGERVKETTYYHCSFWRSEKMVAYLKKGTLVELEGRITADAYAGKDGRPKASLRCRVNRVKILAWPTEVDVIGCAVNGPKAADEGSVDLPF